MNWIKDLEDSYSNNRKIPTTTNRQKEDPTKRYNKSEIIDFIYHSLKDSFNLQLNFGFRGKTYDLAFINTDNKPFRFVIVKESKNTVWSKKQKSYNKVRAKNILANRQSEIDRAKLYCDKVDFVCAIANAREYVRKIILSPYRNSVWLGK